MPPTDYRLEDAMFALPCSHVYAILPSLEPILMVPVVMPIRLPRCTTLLSTYTVEPSGAGLR